MNFCKNFLTRLGKELLILLHLDLQFLETGLGPLELTFVKDALFI